MQQTRPEPRRARSLGMHERTAAPPPQQIVALQIDLFCTPQMADTVGFTAASNGILSEALPVDATPDQGVCGVDM
jgi:hypothetical protein